MLRVIEENTLLSTPQQGTNKILFLYNLSKKLSPSLDALLKFSKLHFLKNGSNLIASKCGTKCQALKV